MINILSYTNKKHQKILSRSLHSRLKKIQGPFKDLHRNLRTFQGKMEFKDFLRPSPKIQGLFKTVRSLENSLSWLHVLDKSSCIRKSHVAVLQWTSKKCTKKCDAYAERRFACYQLSRQHTFQEMEEIFAICKLVEGVSRICVSLYVSL